MPLPGRIGLVEGPVRTTPKALSSEEYRAPPQDHRVCRRPGLVSQAAGLLLAETARVTAWARAGGGWRGCGAADGACPGKILTDLAMTLVLSGDCVADVAVLRAQPELAGPVASDPVISQLVSALAADAPRVLREIRKARAAARERDWALAAGRAPVADGDLIPVESPGYRCPLTG